MNETKKIKGKVGVVNIKVETMPKDEQQIKRIKFETGTGDYISWKPRIIKTIIKNKFECEISIPLEFDLMPKKLIELNNIIREKGSVQINAEYTLMRTEEGNEYRFITSEDELNKWVIVNTEIQETQIE